MKLQITKTTIDLSELNESLLINDRYRQDDDSIILMNQETLNLLTKSMMDIIPDISKETFQKQMGSLPVYKGHRIIIDNTLNFGKVDIR